MTAAVLVAGCAAPTQAPVSALPAMTIPADNPMTPAKVALGKQLFVDTRLSGSGKPDPHKTPLMRPTGLTEAEIDKIVAILQTLTSNEG
jgi:Spy/CpxP family protein refolding chaperone